MGSGKTTGGTPNHKTKAKTQKKHSKNNRKNNDKAKFRKTKCSQTKNLRNAETVCLGGY